MKNDSSRFGHIIQLFTVLLTAILISLFFADLVLVGKIQGTARVVNYAGLVRGKTQRIVKLEISGTPEDDLLGDVASYIEGLRFGSSELDLVRLDDADFQAKMTALSSEFDDLRNELILVRQRGYTETAIIAKSEHFFQTCDEATNLAEVYSQKRATALDCLEKVVLADIVGLLLLFGYQIFKALRYAAANHFKNKSTSMRPPACPTRTSAKSSWTRPTRRTGTRRSASLTSTTCAPSTITSATTRATSTSAPLPNSCVWPCHPSTSWAATAATSSSLSSTA